MLLEIGGPSDVKIRNDIQKYENLIKKSLWKGDKKSLRMIDLLNEEVEAKNGRIENSIDDPLLIHHYWRWDSSFPDEYPSLEKLEKQHKQRMSIAAGYYRKEMAGRIEALRDAYGSGYTNKALLKKRIFEEVSTMARERLEKSKVKHQNLAGYISDCLKVITNWAEDLNTFVPWVNRRLLECIVELGKKIPAKAADCQFVTGGERRSWKIMWETIKPFQDKIQKIKDNLCMSSYRAAMQQIIFRNSDFSDDGEPKQKTPDVPENEVKEVMYLIDLYSEHDKNGKAREKEDVSDKLYEYFSSGLNRDVLAILPVEYLINLSGCGIGVNAVKDCFALVKDFIRGNGGKADYAGEYADAIARRANYVCTTDFSDSFKYRTLRYLHEEMKQLCNLHPGHERPQSRYAELLLGIIHDSSTGEDAGTGYHQELRALAWTYPGNNTVRECYRQAMRLKKSRSDTPGPN